MIDNYGNNETANSYIIQHTEMHDLEMIFKFFEQSIAYQEKHGYPVWKNYDRNAIIQDILNRNQYKIIVDAKPAIVFSVCYHDKVIWQDLEQGDSIYLHRIVVNPEFKGKKLFGKILTWAIDHCHQRNLSHVRMDTWAQNPDIIKYYCAFGFRQVRNYTTPDTLELPEHNRRLALTLLEYSVE